jgi:hypothetical protein
MRPEAALDDLNCRVIGCRWLLLQMELMKDEAIGKLKELGNSLLGHFGLSLDNFKVNQDEAGGGGYNISFGK